MGVQIPLIKMSGTGNTFVLVDAVRHRLSPRQGAWGPLAQALCDPRSGGGADGLLVLERSRKANVRMRIFNPDGSEPSMCGNGVRCLAWYASRQGAGKRLTIETRAGIKRAEIGQGNRVRVDMGAPALVRHMPRFPLEGRTSVHADLIDAGVPHLVCWVRRVDAVAVERLGRRWRVDRRFQPAGTNVDFLELQAVQERSGDDRGARVRRCRIKLRTYERGVEAETQACGTGAVAAAAAVAHALARDRRGSPRAGAWFEVEAHVPGGVLRVQVGARYTVNRGGIQLTHAVLEGTVREQSRRVVRWDGPGSR